VTLALGSISERPCSVPATPAGDEDRQSWRTPAPWQSRRAPTGRPPSTVSHELLSSRQKSSSLADTARTADFGQSGQRRTFAQDGRSGLSAVAGAASATSAAASSPPRKRAARRRRGRPRPGRGMSPLRSQAPRCPMGQTRLKDTFGVTSERVSGVPLRGLEMCLAKARGTPMARSQGSRWSTGSTRWPAAASRRSSVSSRRLWGAHSSVVAGSHDHAVDATIGTVALRSRRSWRTHYRIRRARRPVLAGIEQAPAHPLGLRPRRGRVRCVAACVRKRELRSPARERGGVAGSGWTQPRADRDRWALRALLRALRDRSIRRPFAADICRPAAPDVRSWRDARRTSCGCRDLIGHPGVASTAAGEGQETLPRVEGQKQTGLSRRW
jgi:hypothetical protein